MTKTGIIAVAFALAAFVFVFVVAQGMRDSGFIIWAYSVTAAVVAGYVWSLSRRLDRAEKSRSQEGGGTGP